MPRPSPERFDNWLESGHEIIKEARDDNELQRVEALAELLKAEARLERISRASRSQPLVRQSPQEAGPAMSAAECALASGWTKGQKNRSGFSPRFFYDHAAEFGFAIRQGRSLRFARTGFLRWLAGRSLV